MGLEGVRGIVADSKAYSRRTLGVCLEHKIDLVTLSPAHVCRAAGTRSLGARSNPPCPSWWRNLAGRRTKHHAAGMAKVCADRWRSSTAMGG